MPADMISVGPVDIWLAQNDQNTPAFLGHCADGIQIRWMIRTAPHKNDLGGTEEPYDFSYQGRSAMVSGVLTRLDWLVLEAFSDLTLPGTLASDPAGDNPGDIGTLLMTEKVLPRLFLRFPRARLFPGVGMANGIRFRRARLEQESWADLKPGAATAPVSWYCQRELDPTYVSVTGLGWGRWTLYDKDISALPAAGT